MTARPAFLAAAALALLGSFTLAPGDTLAQGSSCHLLTAAHGVPNGFGAAYDTLSSARELLLTATCSSTSATLKIGTGNTLQYIYEQGYAWHDNRWQPFTYDGAQKIGPWIIGQGSATLSRSQSEMAENNFFVGYLCTWTGRQSGWKCGCRDSACASQHWQLQAFRGGGAEAPAGGAPTVPPSSYPLMEAGNQPKKLFFTGKLLPDAHTAPINPPYYMNWFLSMPNGPNAVGGTYRTTATHYFPHKSMPDWIDEWERVSPLTLLMENRHPSTPVGEKDKWGFRVDGAEYFAPPGRYDSRIQGIVLDEFSGTKENRDIQRDNMPHLLEAKRNNPSWLITAASPHPFGRFHEWVVTDFHEAIDIFEYEAYFDKRGTCNYRDKADEVTDLKLWIDDIKELGIEEKSTLLLGTGEVKRPKRCYHPTPQFFEEQIAYVREHLPQASVSFYRNFLEGYLPGGRAEEEKIKDWYRQYGEIVKKYYFEPAPSVSITSLSDGQTVSGTVPVRASFTAGTSGKPLREYRYFIDNRVVHVGETPVVNWDTARTGSGRHTITVHGVAEDYLVGVDQVEVTVR